MKYFHGKNKKKSYFEGWYLKHQAGNKLVSLIAAYHIDEYGVKKASIQIIRADKSYTVWYPGNQFYAEEERFFVRIGKNIFYEHGCRLDINTFDVQLKGDIHYGKFRRLAYDIMGPFQYVPKMQCSHGILSMSHKVGGSLTLNGNYMDLNGGSGYIESDRGSSFPKSYIWVQCEEMKELSFSIMVSIADIPFGAGHFTGCICAIMYKGKQFRLATYRHVKVKKNEGNVIWLSQGNYTLLIQLKESFYLPLKAPASGCMNRTIKEQLTGTARFRLYDKKDLIFDLTSARVSVEKER